MDVKAKHNFKHDGVYHAGGEEFVVTDAEYRAIEQFVTALDKRDEKPVSSVFPPDEVKTSSPEQTAQPRRGRRRKAEN